MSAYVFAGPSLPTDDRAEVPGLYYLPPVAQGDLLPLIEQGAKTIGIIDGFFEAVPSVLHKEVLYAISQGVIVIGGASMGALRAAELAPFGMIGIGTIYEAYSQGRIEDDDEVAVLHGPAETDYLALSDAMVDIRATLESAILAKVISELECEQLLLFAKKRNYRERRFDQLIRDGLKIDALRPCIASLETWLPSGRIPQKRRDAQAVLQEVIRQYQEGHPVKINWQLQWTDAFDLVVHETSVNRNSVSAVERDVINELCLRPSEFEHVRDRALLRGLANQRPFVVEAKQRVKEEETLFAIFAEHDLLTGVEQREWLKKQQIDEQIIPNLVNDHQQLMALRENPPNWLWREIISELRLSGLFHELNKRADQKRAAANKQFSDIDYQAAHAAIKASLIERFLQVHGRKTAFVGEETSVRCFGFPDRAELGRFLLIDHLYHRSITPSGRSDA